MRTNPYDPNAWSFPIPGITGWRDRHEGPFWVRHHRLAPYCRLGAMLDYGRVPPAERPGNPLPVSGPPCLTAPGFPCCRWGELNRRGGVWGEPEPWRRRHAGSRP